MAMVIMFGVLTLLFWTLSVAMISICMVSEPPERFYGVTWIVAVVCVVVTAAFVGSSVEFFNNHAITITEVVKPDVKN